MHTGVWTKVISQISHNEISVMAIRKPATQVTGFLNYELLVSNNAY